MCHCAYIMHSVSNESNNYHLHFAPMTSTEEPVTSNDAVDSNNHGKFEWQQGFYIKIIHVVYLIFSP